MPAPTEPWAVEVLVKVGFKTNISGFGLRFSNNSGLTLLFRHGEALDKKMPVKAANRDRLKQQTNQRAKMYGRLIPYK